MGVTVALLGGAPGARGSMFLPRGAFPHAAAPRSSTGPSALGQPAGEERGTEHCSGGLGQGGSGIHPMAPGHLETGAGGAGNVKNEMFWETLHIASATPP